MIETALKVTDNNIPNTAIEKIIDYGKEILNEPIELLDNVEEILRSLQGHYRIVVATKGDLLDQERKLKKSGLSHYFHHIEVMSEKKEGDYLKLIKHLDIRADEFLMIGNSLKSDVIPVLNIGGHAIHVPYHTTWAHEQVEATLDHANFRHVERLDEVLGLILVN